jgi:hypothetical protein
MDIYPQRLVADIPYPFRLEVIVVIDTGRVRGNFVSDTARIVPPYSLMRRIVTPRCARAISSRSNASFPRIR